MKASSFLRFARAFGFRISANFNPLNQFVVIGQNKLLSKTKVAMDYHNHAHNHRRLKTKQPTAHVQVLPAPRWNGRHGLSPVE